FGFLQTELDRAKASLMNAAEKSFREKDKSESGAIVQQYVNNFLQGNPIPGVEHRYKFLQQVLPTISLQEINAIAKQMPSTSNAFTLVEAPTKQKDKLPNNSELLKALVTANNKPVKAYGEKEVPSALLDKDPVQGKITPEQKNEKLGTTNLILNNAVTIKLKLPTLKN